MPQGPLRASVANNPSNTGVQLAVDAFGNLLTASGTKATYNITAATVIKAVAGRLCKISVIVAGAAGTANDCATTGAVAVTNEIAAFSAVVGIINVDWNTTSGITIAPGAAQVVAVSYI